MRKLLSKAWAGQLMASLAGMIPRVRVPGGSSRRGKWPEYIGCAPGKWESDSRQRRRRAQFVEELGWVRRTFGHTFNVKSLRGSFTVFHWPDNMSRKIGRAIAWRRASTQLKFRAAREASREQSPAVS